jgi:hypothetical protein
MLLRRNAPRMPPATAPIAAPTGPPSMKPSAAPLTTPMPIVRASLPAVCRVSLMSAWAMKIPASRTFSPYSFGIPTPYSPPAAARLSSRGPSCAVMRLSMYEMPTCATNDAAVLSAVLVVAATTADPGTDAIS